ncbi:hypothetical protein CRUP_026934 [Coryphaenoides rupestris]|nr:hypothetical protein CRUP_026934 [Coryphaenoides rupestris]
MKSDYSMNRPPQFKDGHPLRKKRQHQERSKVQAELIKRTEEDAYAFLDKEMKKLWSVLFLNHPQCSESQREEEEEVVVMDGKKEEQRRRAIQGVGDIVQFCLLERNQEDLADTLRSIDLQSSTVKALHDYAATDGDELEPGDMVLCPSL